LFKQDELNIKLLNLFFSDREFAIINQNYIEEEFFEVATYKEYVRFIKNFLKKFSQLPTKEIILEFFENPKNISIDFNKEILKKILNTEVDETTKQYLYQIVPELYRKNKLLPTIIEGFKNINKLEGDDNYLDDFYKKLQEIVVFSKTKDIGLNFEKVEERYVEINQEYGTPLKTNWKILDEIMAGGFYKKRIYMWSAPPGYYKTAILANIAVQLYLNGYNVIFFTLELSRGDISHRCDQILTKIESKRLKYETNLLKEYIENAKTLGAGFLYFQELNDGASVTDIESYCEKIRIKEGKNIDVILVDYVDLLKPLELQKNWKSYEIQGRATRELRNFARLYNLAVVTVTQSTRGALENGGTKEEGGMELVADSFNKPRIVDFFAQIIMTKSDRMLNLMKFHIVKNRLGASDMKIIYKVNPLIFYINEAEESEQNIDKNKKEE